MTAVGVGVIGLGFMGAVHARAYAEAGARLVAVCDRSAARLRGEVGGDGNLGGADVQRLFDPASVHATPDLTAFLATPGLDLVSVCTPTDTHAATATAALRAGKHVIVEKPVALEVEAVLTLDAQARRADRLCMPAMCMRFWPAWAWLASAIADGRFGALRALRLDRLGAPPAWGMDFYNDTSRSGGALFDLHVHDTDFVCHALGTPRAVRSAGDARHLTTMYAYEDSGLQVVAQGGWLKSPAWPFRMRYLAEFDAAVCDWELGRAGELRVYHGGGTTETPDLDPRDGWRVEVEAMVKAVARRAATPPATMASAAVSTGVLLAERESLRTGSVVAVG